MLSRSVVRMQRPKCKCPCSFHPVCTLTRWNSICRRLLGTSKPMAAAQTWFLRVPNQWKELSSRYPYMVCHLCRKLHSLDMWYAAKLMTELRPMICKAPEKCAEVLAFKRYPYRWLPGSWRQCSPIVCHRRRLSVLREPMCPASWESSGTSSSPSRHQ